MARIVLLRHAHSQANKAGVLAGRVDGIDLSREGLHQASKLIERLGTLRFHQIRVSPISRCHQTLEPWLAAQESFNRNSFLIDEDLNEIDYGKWSGRRLSTLRLHPKWKIVQNRPSDMTFPNGESFLDAQKRAARALVSASSGRSSAPRLIVSHGDVIKLMITSALGMPLDEFQKLVIDPASLTILDSQKGKIRLLAINETGASVRDLIVDGQKGRETLGGGSGKIGLKR